MAGNQQPLLRKALYRRNKRKYELYMEAYPDDSLFSKIGIITPGGLEELLPSTSRQSQTFVPHPTPSNEKLVELPEECGVMGTDLDATEISIGTNDAFASDSLNTLEYSEPVGSKLNIVVTSDEDNSMDTACHVAAESSGDARKIHVENSSGDIQKHEVGSKLNIVVISDEDNSMDTACHVAAESSCDERNIHVENSIDDIQEHADVELSETSSDSDVEEMRESDSGELNDTNKQYLRRPMNDINLPFVVKPDVTTHDQLLIIIATAVKHRLTYETVLTMLKSANLLSVYNGLPTTKKALWKALCRNESIISRHMYCRQCKDFIGKGVIPDKECACEVCGPIKGNKSLSYFIQLSLHSQLGELLAIPGIVKSLQYRFTRLKKNEDSVEDIYDGEEYKRKCKPGGFLSNPMNYSFTFNTDGCSVSESSKVSAWPILLQINELPPHARKRHMLLAGVWVDNVHPPLNTLLLPTVKELQQVYEKGITWKPDSSSEVTSKFVTLVCSVDSIARPAILRMTQFNGAFGCTFCYAPGVIYPGKYPMEEHAECRTHSDIRKHMQEAFKEKEKVFGVKGPSALMALPEFDLALGVIVESMHNVFLGVIKHHTELLLFGKASEKWDAGTPKNLQFIQNRLLKIRNHSRVSRKPREISSMKMWKASEWRNWLLYYCLTCLEGLLEESYLNHLALLCRAAYIFNKDSITKEEILESRQLLSDYVEQFQETFRIEHMYYNIHLLTHLADTVQNWGPFWAHSAFPFEAWNKRIIDSVTSPNARPLQIVNRFLMARFVYSAQYDSGIREPIRQTISEILQDKNVLVHNRAIEVGTTHFSGIGKENERCPHDWEMKALRIAGYECDNLHSFQRAKINGVEYRNTAVKETRFSNHTVYCCNHCVGEIVEIVHFEHNHKQICGVFIELLQYTGDAFGATHIQNVIRTKNIIFVTGDKINAPGLTIQTSNGLRAIELANCWETD